MHSWNFASLIGATLVLGLNASCVSSKTSQGSRPKAASKTDARWEASQWSEFLQLDCEENCNGSYMAAIKAHLPHWRRLGQKQIQLGEGHAFRASDYVTALEKTLLALRAGRPVALAFSKNFQLITERNTQPFPVLLTGYYEPVIEARTHRSARFFQPLYAEPKNLVALDFRSYSRAFPGWGIWSSKNYPRRVRGRLTAENKVVPYYSRKQIDTQGLLSEQAEVLAYLEPIDAFFLQIQGSGVLRFPGGKTMGVGYADQNGHKYYAIGRALLAVIPKEKMSMQAIREFLSTLEPEQLYEFLNLNPSYVFFRKLEGRGMTSMNTEVMAKVTLASDPRAYPRGIFSVLQSSWDESADRPFRRLVIHQDTGGAIKGLHRADLFVGRGQPAESLAGQLKAPAKIHMLVPKAP